jgi:hypothetical protein
MFGQRLIGYAHIVDAEVQDTSDQPTTQNGKQPNWRSWFGKGTSGPNPDGGADPGTDFGTDELVDDRAVADEPAIIGTAAAGGDPDLIDPSRRRRRRDRQAAGLPLVTRPLINPRLTADPRLRVWIVRTAVCLVAFIAVTIWKDWRYGVTALVIYAVLDTLFRSKTMGITPSSVRVTAAQRSTARRLKLLQAAGYMSLNTRRIPDTKTVIDHIVVGPSGIFALDSQRLDTRLPITAKGGMLYHGPVSQESKLDHAQFEADQAATLIGAELGQRVRVRPAMIIYGPKLPWVIMRLKGVDVFDGGHISNYFRRQSKATIGHHLDNAQVALVFAAAAHALPDLDT